MKTIPSDSPSRALAEALAAEVPSARLAAVLSDALASTVMSRSGQVLPDTRSRLQAASLILAYQIGTPVQRLESVVVTMDADQSKDTAERLRHSPALRAAMRKALAEAEPVDV
jgi:hypothetical protein